MPPDRDPSPKHVASVAPHAGEAWRIILDKRALPLPVLRPITIGSDARNGIQLNHGSIRPFHARLQKQGRALCIQALEKAAVLRINGKAVQAAMLQGGELVSVGSLTVRIERGEIAPAVTSRQQAPMSVEQEFYTLFRRELRRAPWFAISLVLHILLFIWADHLIWRNAMSERTGVILAAVNDLDGAMPLTPAEDEPELPPEMPEFDPELPDIEPADVDTEEDLHYLEDVLIQSVNVGDLRHIGMGEGTVGGGLGRRGIRLEGVQGPLRTKLQTYRASGLDLVFLIDTTASMESFLRAARRAVDRIITDLSALVPNTRLGIIAYRDNGDEYVTRATPISSDRYAILNFLEGLEAKGGGDVPEAILDAVTYGFDEMPWRSQSHRVLVIVADAPPHPEERARLRMRLRSATRSTRHSTVVSTIFTGRGQVSPARQAEAERALREIAEAGGGEFSYMDNPSQVVSQLIGVTLGSRFRGEANQLLRERAQSPRQAMIRKKVEERDIDWLLRKLHITPVEPGVVAGLIRIGSPAVALRCLDVVSEPSQARPVREAALYILRRVTRYGGSLDFTRSLAAQKDEMRDLQNALERAYRRN